MRFALTANEAEKDPRNSSSSAGGDWIRYLKNGDTTFRILQEPKDWKTFWQHFNPGGFSFPCNGEPTCPGCTSDVERMRSTTKRAIFNVLEVRDGTPYVNVYEIPMRVHDKLMNRFARLDTITDRDYTITKYKTSGDKVDYDVEGDLPSPLVGEYELRDVEQMLQEAYDKSWGDPSVSAATKEQAAASQKDSEVAAKVAAHKEAVQRQMERPPSEPEAKQDTTASGEDTVITEAELRAMPLIRLLKFCDSNGLDVPEGLDAVDAIVDWMMQPQS